MKLLDEQGLPFVCDKSKPWDHEVSCPLLTVQYTTQVSKVDFLTCIVIILIFCHLLTKNNESLVLQ